MQYLSQLTPAEVYILTDENATHREYLKITFIDLLFKQVLKTFEVERQPHISHKVRIYTYVTSGPNFKNYNFKNHEKFFLDTFRQDDSIEILFRNLVKIGYQKSRTLAVFKNELIKTPILQKCFSQNILQKIFYRYRLTEYGKELKRKVEKEIQSLNSKFTSLDTIDNQEALALIKVIGGNIFLLEYITYDLLDQIDSDLVKQMNRKETNSNGSGCSGCGWNFDSYSSNFDSGCSSSSGSGGGSGCSACGGCGGGCGGCGGCG
ncbi:MAG: hypothetical protein Q8K02_14830 [Flavobacterium sp.]|nr:hypothetical protein [Flavobacterium sp.]